MIEPPTPGNEAARLSALRELRILDTPAEERFDRIARFAGDLFRTPIALISLVDADRQWFKSRVGLDASETPRAVSFCGHAILGDDVFVIEDALADPRFADNPLVTGPPHIRFYAGMPLRARDGLPLGTLCIIDRAPRRFDAADARRLADLGAWAERELNLAVYVDRMVTDMRNTFVRLVSHELRTPTTGIVGALELIRSGVAGDSVEALARVASDSANQLTRVIDGIVEIAEIDAHHIDLKPSRIDLPVFVEAAAESFSGAAASARIKLTPRGQAGLTIEIAPKPLARILRTLIDNALRFAPTDTEVNVETGALDVDWARVEIRDRGPGVPEHHLPYLFQPFAPADAGDSRLRDGIGISLAVSRKLATALGARLRYEPSSAGGSRFILDLPRRRLDDTLGTNNASDD